MLTTAMFAILKLAVLLGVAVSLVLARHNNGKLSVGDKMCWWMALPQMKGMDISFVLTCGR